MGIINNRFISAFLDAFPSPKKKVFSETSTAEVDLCNDNFSVKEPTWFHSKGRSLELLGPRPQSVKEAVQNSAYGSISRVEVLGPDETAEHPSSSRSSIVERETKKHGETNVSVESTSSVILPTKESSNDDTAGTIKWSRVTLGLRKFYGERIYRSWLKFLSFDRINSGQVFLFVPTGFVREWIMVNYSDNILEFFRSEDPSINSIEIKIAEECTGEVLSATEESPVQAVSIKPKDAEGRFIRESLTDNLSSSIDRNRTFDSFVVGKSNELAFAASKRVANASELPIPGSNPLFLYGGVGLGKTHLMHAIVWHIKEHYKNRRVIYLSAEKFMHKYITALKNKDMMSFKQIFRSVDVLMVDDVQFISGKESTQEEFFHTFNALIEQNKQLVISADRSPSDLQGVEERIQSRLSWGLVADINQTTFELRVGILESKLEQMKSNVVVPKKVVEFMAKNIVSNVRELEGALNKVIAHSEITGGIIEVDSVKDLLADILRTNSISVTLENILAKVSEYFSIKISDLKSQRRVKDVAYGRQVCMFLAKSLTQRSLIDIGKFLGGRDHATVIHSVRKIEILMKNDARVAEDIRILTKRLT